MAKIVMFWDCPYCRNKKIPGYLRECKDGCGAPRPRLLVFTTATRSLMPHRLKLSYLGKPILTGTVKAVMQEISTRTVNVGNVALLGLPSQLSV